MEDDPLFFPAMKSIAATLAGATCFLALLSAPRALAGADYCHTTADGSYACIQSVFGPRNSRGIVYVINGRVYADRVNCYNYGYERTSLIAVACWSYERVADSAPKDLKSMTEPSEAAKKAITSSGVADKNNLISPDKIKRSLPLEMK
ncbi:hypothetical protein KBY78_13835 [Synechococcus sp. EJ6-Ellesmere]|nr:hypothetical protein [Synechococcus sp. EJ6-Ellesmere]